MISSFFRYLLIARKHSLCIVKSRKSMALLQYKCTRSASQALKAARKHSLCIVKSRESMVLSQFKCSRSAKGLQKKFFGKKLDSPT